MSTSSTTESPSPVGLVEVGRVGRAHGVRGDVRVDFYTHRAERTVPGARLHAAGRWLVVERAERVVSHPPRRSPYDSTWLVHFEGVEDPERARTLSGAAVWAEPLGPDGRLWVHEIVGARVVDATGTDRGRVVAVVDSPAHAMLELDSGALVPVPFVVRREDGVLHVATPEGIFE
jgi:16S rRNA processing protein RimM